MNTTTPHTPGIDTERVTALASEVLDWRFKAVPAHAWGSTVAEFLATKPTLDDLGTPLLTLDASALEHNLHTMAVWCAAADVYLAPHGKTTMAPALWQRQLAAGARAITLANLAQVRVAIHAAPGMRLVGVSGYEGALAHDASPASLTAVENYLRKMAELHDRLRDEDLLDAADATEDTVITAGGSAYFDTVVRELAPLGQSGTRILLRSGAYIVHDDGFYRTISPLARGAGPVPLRSAMHGWPRRSPNPNGPSHCWTTESVTSPSTKACPDPNSSEQPAGRVITAGSPPSTTSTPSYATPTSGSATSSA